MNLKKLTSILAILFCQTRGEAHDIIQISSENDPYTEKTKLLSIQEKTTFGPESDSESDFVTIDSLSLEEIILPSSLPKDIWRNIIFQCLSPSSADPKSIGSIKNILSLSTTCKSLYVFTNSFPTFTLSRDLLRSYLLSKQFSYKWEKSQKLSEKNVQRMSSYLKSNEKLTPKVTMHQHHLKEANLSDEMRILEFYDPLFDEIKNTLTPLAPKLLEYAKENQKEKMKNKTLTDLSYLATIAQQPVPDYEKDLARDYKKTFRRTAYIRFMIGATTIALAALVGGGMYLYLQYPTEAVEAAFQAFMNRTTYDVSQNPYYWNRNAGNNIPCLDVYWFNQQGWDTIWWRDLDKNITGYAITLNKTPLEVTGANGTVLDWLNALSAGNPFNVSFWYNHMMSVANGTIDHASNLICNRNPDNTSLTCAYAASGPYKCAFDLCLSMTRGDAVCAGNLAAQPWRTQLEIYWSVGGLVSFIFVWLWLGTFLL